MRMSASISVGIISILTIAPSDSIRMATRSGILMLVAPSDFLMLVYVLMEPKVERCYRNRRWGRHDNFQQKIDNDQERIFECFGIMGRTLDWFETGIIHLS